MNITMTRTAANFAVRLLTDRAVPIALTEITVMGQVGIGVCGAAPHPMAPAAPTAPQVTTRSSERVGLLNRKISVFRNLFSAFPKPLGPSGGPGILLRFPGYSFWRRVR